jgi:hypothetical protein
MNLEVSPWNLVEAPKSKPLVAKRPLRIKLYALLLVLDLLCVAAAVLSGSLVRFGQIMPDGWLGVSGAIVALYTLTAVGVGAYSQDVLRNPMRGIARSAGSWLLAFALLFLLSYFLKVDQQLSRLMTGTTLVIGLVSLILVRQLAGDVIRRRWRGCFTNDILLVDGPPIQASATRSSSTSRTSGSPRISSDATMLIRFSDLLRGADRVVVSCSRAAAIRWAQMLRAAASRARSCRGTMITLRLWASPSSMDTRPWWSRPGRSTSVSVWPSAPSTSR